jgi:hypothetical protein
MVFSNARRGPCVPYGWMLGTLVRNLKPIYVELIVISVKEHNHRLALLDQRIEWADLIASVIKGAWQRRQVVWRGAEEALNRRRKVTVRSDVIFQRVRVDDAVFAKKFVLSRYRARSWNAF